MAGQVEPPELARLLDFAERPREHDWSLRAALTRYAQPQPQRVSDLLELVRRIEFALKPHTKLVEREGQALWQAVDAGDDATDADADAYVVGLLRAMVDLDRLGDVLAGWAFDRSRERPDGEVDAVTADVSGRLEALGVPREERQRPPGRRGRG